MTDALSAEQRAKLERLVGRARTMLEDDLAARAAGRYGIDPDGTIADETTLRLDPSGLAERREIVEVVDHLRSEGDSPSGAVARLIREAVFTHLNRLVAIRIAEALGLLPESLAQGDRSQGYRDIKELAPLLAADETNGYWTYLQLCGDELAGDVPNLFDPRNPLLALAPSPAALRDIVELFADTGSSELWTAPDSLGWTYQFFNTGEERRAMREASAAPRNSRELAVRNQFFTPRYVVDFLVQNSLGRRLLDADPRSPLIDDLPLLVDPPNRAGEPLGLGDVRVLDPACGSGHFLLAAYDLLERAWQHAGVPPSDAAPRVVASLWGIEIDPRCTQVASAAILFRARRSCPSGELPRPNVICARSLPATATGLDEVLAQIDPTQRGLINAFSEALQDAPILGPLLRIEERIESEIRTALTGATSGGFAEAIEPEVVSHLQEQLLAGLQTVSDAASSTPAERMLAAEADDAVRFVLAMLQRYDAVLQNPPFGEPVSVTKSYIKSAFPWIPTKDHNLLAAFVGRALELTKPAGYVGAITSRVGMFLKTFLAWRREVFFEHRLQVLADLGYGVMEQALVEAAAYVVQRSQPIEEPSTFIRLLKDADRPRALELAVHSLRVGEPDRERVFRVAPRELVSVPGSPLAYWLSPSLRGLYDGTSQIEKHAADVRVGLQTGDDARFLRTAWEVDPLSIATSRKETHEGKRWVFHAKGGSYSPYWSDLHLVVRWATDGEEVRKFTSPSADEYYFRSGITWPRRTASGFGPRVLPAGAIIGNKGPAVFAKREPLTMLAWLSSRPVIGLIAAGLAAGDEVTSGGAAKSYEVGIVQRLPWPALLENDSELQGLMERLVRIRRDFDLGDETSRLFHYPQVLKSIDPRKPDLRAAVESFTRDYEDSILEMIDLHLQIERKLVEACQLAGSDIAYLDEEVGPHPGNYAETALDRSALADEYAMPMDRLIDHVVEEQGGAKHIVNQMYIADRRTEVLAHAHSSSPAQIIGFRRELSVLPPGSLETAASDIVSYLVGLAFGRWDVREVGGEAELGELFDTLPTIPPAMLVEERKSEPARPSDYPLEVAFGQVLFDQPGHSLDIVDRVFAAASLLVDDTDRLFVELGKYVKGRDLREHLRRHFFKDHLSR